MKEGKGVVCFDFDDTLVSGNSDEYVWTDLCPSLSDDVKKWWKEHEQSFCWTDMMAWAMNELPSRGISISSVSQFSTTLPLMKGVGALLRYLHEELNFHVIILSDANVYFITQSLQGAGIRSCVDDIYANPAWEDCGMNVLRIQRYTTPDNPHNCTNKCPPNMCKGCVLKDIMNTHSPSCVWYVGDGENDVCAASMLRDGDVVFPRAGFAMEKKLSMDKTVLQEGVSVVPWTSHDSLLSRMKTIHT